MRELKSAYATDRKESPPPRVGQLVLIKEPAPRLLWKLGRIEKVFEGRDGKVRSCTVRVPRGVMLTRPIQLIYPLEMECA